MTAMAKTLPQDRSQAHRIADTINKLDQGDIESRGAWEALADLSSATSFEGIDANLDSVVIRTDGSFEAVADVYVTLNYGGKRDAAALGDAYPATVRGHLTDSAIHIDSIEIQTGSFYD